MNLLVKKIFNSRELVTELRQLLIDVLNNFNNEDIHNKNINIISRHQGGKQTFAVFECTLQNKKIAIKFYKPIVTHLIVHSVARDYITKHLTDFHELYDFTLRFPDTIAIVQTKQTGNYQPFSILIQEWIENAEEIHKFFPKEHVAIIKTIIKKLTTDNGFMVDIMSKNWLASDKNSVNYVDLVLFNPKGNILAKIKSLAQRLE